MPYLRATMIGDTPGCKLSAAISRFCSAVQRRRRSRPVITSIRRLRVLVRSVVGASSAANATAITPSSSLKDDRWRDSHRVAQCAAATPLTGKPLVSHQVIVQLIANTRTAAGLTVACRIDTGAYQKGIKVSDDEMDALNIQLATFHGEWNYTFTPRQPDT